MAADSRKVIQSSGANTLSSTAFTDNPDLEPYVGPRPFKRDKFDQLRFFGRDIATSEIVSLIASHRLVLIYAQSGAGKTSIFNAQVTPELEDYGFEVLPMARVQITTSSTASATDTTGTVVNTIVENDSKDSDDNEDVEINNMYIYNAIQSLRPNLDSKYLLNLSLFEFLDKYFPNHKDENGYTLPQVLIFDQLEESV